MCLDSEGNPFEAFLTVKKSSDDMFEYFTGTFDKKKQENASNMNTVNELFQAMENLVDSTVVINSKGSFFSFGFGFVWF